MKLLLLGVPDRPGIVEDLLFLPIFGDGDGGRGAIFVASRKCSIWAPLIWGSTMAFQRRKFVLVSFSDGGDPRELAPLLEVEEEA